MSSTGINGGIAADGLRERLPNNPAAPQQASSSDSAQAAVKSLNDDEAKTDKSEEEKRTYGRTPDGTVFTVPHTHDMVSQLLSPTQPKNASDIAIVTVLAWLVGMLFILPKSASVPLFAVIFLFWRACYNAGIGYLLHIQSHHKRLTTLAKRSGIFENPSSGKNSYPTLYSWLKREMETKIPKDYDFESAPLEYNTWLLFRRVVDLILMSDFVSYCCFAAACGGTPPGENVLMTIARWACGILLVAFNLWVKLDAHRVVKDYAWYWGDFFYLIDQELTFDGVFEMAPHPMYSVGYAGYYGISLMAASYRVLFISIVAHAAQFAFLAFVENPHIERVYNPPPPPRKRTMSGHVTTDENGDIPLASETLEPGHVNGYPPIATTSQPSPIHNIIGITNLDFHRVTDASVTIVQFILYSVALLSPSNQTWQTYFVVLAVLSRLWYSLGMGYILDRQSKRKKWTRHFVKYGESTEEAWRQWKGLYHLSMTMTYTTFICAAWKMYHLPDDWTLGMALLRHVVGLALIALQGWTIASIYESLGEFGWFFGDFFFDQRPKLTYGGIYRFLNNPERVIGLAGLWGATIITFSKAIFFLALLSHILTLAFIQFIERPHMQKLYGETLRADSGVSRSIKRSLPRPLQAWQGSVDRVLEETLDVVEDFIDSALPKLAAGADTFVRDTTSLIKNYPTRITISRLSPDVAGFNPAEYSLKIQGTPSTAQTPTTSPTSPSSSLDRTSGRESLPGQKPQQFHSPSDSQTLAFEYGAPIHVRWRAPINHDKADWIGLYMVADNASRSITRLNSQGRWIATTRDAWSDSNADTGIVVDDHVGTDNVTNREFRSGEVVFQGDKLWWTQSVFEFRLHHAGGHNVMAISRPFEIRIARFDEDNVSPDVNGVNMRKAVEGALLPVVRNCFDRDPDVAPESVEEGFGEGLEREGRYARRVVFAVGMMFGIEFAPEVVLADGCVKNLAWRITNAKKVLEPYSLAPSKGRESPT